MHVRSASLLLFAVACASRPLPTTTSTTKASEPVIAMSAFEDKGYELRGAEYWPYRGAEEPRYPEDVLWGFYPKKGEVPPGETEPNADDASPAAIACAAKSFAALKAFIASDPPALRRITNEGTDLGYTNKFYLWTNDYTHASEPYPPGVRSARLWYWKRKTPDPARPNGYWKWEATLTREGACMIPEPEQRAAMLEEQLALVLQPRRRPADPGLGSETRP